MIFSTGCAGCLRCEMFWDVGGWRCGMFGMWDVQDGQCRGCEMLGWDVADLECPGCGMFGIQDIGNVEC